ncbi:hypothetical protein N9891_01520 [bacterium]|nr:hypothetical protein [bacterium]
MAEESRALQSDEKNEWLSVGIEVLTKLMKSNPFVEAAALLGYLRGIQTEALVQGCPHFLTHTVEFCHKHPDAARLVLVDFGEAGLFSPDRVKGPRFEEKAGWKGRAGD